MRFVSMLHAPVLVESPIIDDINSTVFCRRFSDQRLGLISWPRISICRTASGFRADAQLVAPMYDPEYDDSHHNNEENGSCNESTHFMIAHIEICFSEIETL